MDQKIIVFEVLIGGKDFFVFLWLFDWVKVILADGVSLEFGGLDRLGFGDWEYLFILLFFLKILFWLSDGLLVLYFERVEFDRVVLFGSFK